MQARLSQRDRTLLSWLGDHQVLTTPQIAKALFASLRFAQRRLLTLHRLGLIDRFRPLRIGGGTYPWHYVLAQRGAELIAATRDQPPPRPSQTAQRIRRIATSRTLEHQLGVNGFFTDLVSHARTHPGTRLERWWSETECAAPGAFAAGLVSPIRPDGHGIWVQADRRVPFFLEFDTGTEPHQVIRSKLARYNTHVAKGGPAWPVLFWLPNPTRERHLRDLDVTVRVATATPHPGNAEGAGNPAAAVWLVHGAGGRSCALADLMDG